MVAQRGAGPGAALHHVLLLSVCWLNVAAAVSIESPEQLLVALSRAAAPGAPRVTDLELRADVVLSPGAVANYTLPFVVPANHTLTLRGGGCWVQAPQPPPVASTIAGPLLLQLRGPCCCKPQSLPANYSWQCGIGYKHVVFEAARRVTAARPPVLASGQPPHRNCPAIACAAGPEFAQPVLRRKLDFGGIDGLLYFKSGSKLMLRDLHVSGT